MKVKLGVGIYGQPAKLNLTADLLYGKDEKYSAHIFRKEFSLDKGGEVMLPMSYFSDFADTDNFKAE
jgi:hypothetical protein